MDIYYKRQITWCKWPWQDIKETDVVLFSIAKNRSKFESGVFMQLDPSVSVEERKAAVSQHFKIPVKKVKLIKVN